MHIDYPQRQNEQTIVGFSLGKDNYSNCSVNMVNGSYQDPSTVFEQRVPYNSRQNVAQVVVNQSMAGTVKAITSCDMALCKNTNLEVQTLQAQVSSYFATIESFFNIQDLQLYDIVMTYNGIYDVLQDKFYVYGANSQQYVISQLIYDRYQQTPFSNLQFIRVRIEQQNSPLQDAPITQFDGELKPLMQLLSPGQLAALNKNILPGVNIYHIDHFLANKLLYVPCIKTGLLNQQKMVHTYCYDYYFSNTYMYDSYNDILVKATGTKTLTEVFQHYLYLAQLNNFNFVYYSTCMFDQQSSIQAYIPTVLNTANDQQDGIYGGVQQTGMIVTNNYVKDSFNLGIPFYFTFISSTCIGLYVPQLDISLQLYVCEPFQNVEQILEFDFSRQLLSALTVYIRRINYSNVSSTMDVNKSCTVFFSKAGIIWNQYYKVFQVNYNNPVTGNDTIQGVSGFQKSFTDKVIQQVQQSIDLFVKNELDFCSCEDGIKISKGKYLALFNTNVDYGIWSQETIIDPLSFYGNVCAKNKKSMFNTLWQNFDSNIVLQDMFDYCLNQYQIENAKRNNGVYVPPNCIAIKNIYTFENANGFVYSNVITALNTQISDQPFVETYQITPFYPMQVSCIQNEDLQCYLGFDLSQYNKVLSQSYIMFVGCNSVLIKNGSRQILLVRKPYQNILDIARQATWYQPIASSAEIISFVCNLTASDIYDSITAIGTQFINRDFQIYNNYVTLTTPAITISQWTYLQWVVTKQSIVSSQVYTGLTQQSAYFKLNYISFFTYGAYCYANDTFYVKKMYQSYNTLYQQIIYDMIYQRKTQLIQLPLLRIDITSLTVIPSDVSLAVITTNLTSRDDDVGFIRNFMQQWPIMQQLMSGIRTVEHSLLENSCEDGCKQNCPPQVSCIPVVKTQKEVEYYKECNCSNETCKKNECVVFAKKKATCGFVSCEKNVALGYKNSYYQFAYKNVCFYWDCLYHTILYDGCQSTPQLNCVFEEVRKAFTCQGLPCLQLINKLGCMRIMLIDIFTELEVNFCLGDQSSPLDQQYMYYYSDLYCVSMFKKPYLCAVICCNEKSNNFVSAKPITSIQALLKIEAVRFDQPALQLQTAIGEECGFPQYALLPYKKNYNNYTQGDNPLYYLNNPINSAQQIFLKIQVDEALRASTILLQLQPNERELFKCDKNVPHGKGIVMPSNDCCAQGTSHINCIKNLLRMQPNNWQFMYSVVMNVIVINEQTQFQRYQKMLQHGTRTFF